LSKITFACVTQNRIENLKRNVPKVIDYVDRMVFVDGFSVDGTKEWLESYSPKIFVTQRQWDDSFANQYNEYLKHIGDGWVLLCDDDELPSEPLLKILRKYIEDSEDGRKFSVVEFRCHPIEIDRAGKIINDNGPVEYYRQIFFKYEPGMHYMIDLHQCLVGYKNGRMVRRPETYYHIKSDDDNFRNACRNWWIAGVWLSGSTAGYKPQEWHDFRKVVLDAYPEVKVFSDFNSIMIRGNMKQEVKDYLYKIKDIPDEQPNRLFNELRAFWRYYFEKIHPEERL
jgi:glycosyltransferase involved in cell wall biosynthesis